SNGSDSDRSTTPAAGAPTANSSAEHSEDGGRSSAQLDRQGHSREGARPEPAREGIGAEYREVPLDQIEPNPKQPRQVFDEEKLAEFVHSIWKFGFLQPVLGRQVASVCVQLIMGERRWRASQRVETGTIPAIVRYNTVDTLLRDALLENIHRLHLNPLE